MFAQRKLVITPYQDTHRFLLEDSMGKKNPPFFRDCKIQPGL